jgi:hypothetical protein
MQTALRPLVISGLVVSALLAGCAKSSGGQTGDEDALPSGDELFGALGKRGGTSNYQPATSAGELAGDSERVVVARATALRKGRSFVAEEWDAAMHTVVLELEVERTLKGDDEASLHLEFLVGAAEAGAPERLPTARVVVFAVPATRNPFGGYTVEGEGRGLPAGQTLYQVTTPQGFAVASAAGDFGQPFEPSDDALGDGDLDDLIERIEAALAQSSADGGAAGGAGSSGNSGAAGGGSGGRGGGSGGGAAGGTGGVGGNAGGSGSAAGSSGSGAGACFGEFPYEPDVAQTPPPCPASCNVLRGTPFNEADMCLDYATQTPIGCTEGIGPPVVVCVERIEDGQRFQIGQGWPFPGSTIYRTCSDSDAASVLSAQSCQ